MGQRLNIEIKNKGVCLANAYYHWSGYSSSACDMAIEIMDYIDNNPKNCDDRLYAIRLLESTGAGLTDFNPSDEEKETMKKYYKEDYYKKWLETPNELKIAKNHFPNEDFKECEGRNEGLLCVTESGMEETRKWEEARVTINIDTNTVDFDAYWELDANKRRGCSVSDLGFALNDMTFDDLLNLKEVIYGDRPSTYFKLPDGKVIGFIE